MIWTHSAGLPDGPLFSRRPGLALPRDFSAPGTLFHYCNMGYEALAFCWFNWTGGPLGECFRARILAPLGMSATEPLITVDAFDRMVTSYQVTYNERPYPRMGSLSPSPPIAVSAASGCIASTARDMGAYVHHAHQRRRRGEGAGTVPRRVRALFVGTYPGG